MKLDLLAFGAHPDDVELAAGGVMAREAAAGKATGIIDLTRGELGSRGSADIRDREALASAEILGLKIRENLRFKDGFFANDEAHQLEIIKKIRYYRPDIVLCNAVTDRHPDHRKGGDVVAVACFLSGLAKIVTHFDGAEQEAWRPRAVYHYIQDRYIKPDFVVDISDFHETKMKSIKAFSTQFFVDGEDIDAPKTPISSPEFLDFLHGRTIEMGRQAGFKHAEGFTVERFPGVKSVFDLI